MRADNSVLSSAANALWHRCALTSGTRVEDALLTADRVLTALDAGLRRWIGAEGYAALLKRATVLTEAAHPALHCVADLPVNAPNGTNGRVYQGVEIVAAMIALLTTLLSLLGRIIGEEMAARLVENIGQPSPRGVVSSLNRDEVDD